MRWSTSASSPATVSEMAAGKNGRTGDDGTFAELNCNSLCGVCLQQRRLLKWSGWVAGPRGAGAITRVLGCAERGRRVNWAMGYHPNCTISSLALHASARGSRYDWPTLNN